MFPILSTVLAVIVCLLGLDLRADDAVPVVNPLAGLLLLIVPIGEVLVLYAKRKGPALPRRVVQLMVTFLSIYPLAGFAFAMFFLGWVHVPHLLGLDGWVLADKLVLFASYLALSNVMRVYRNRFTCAAGLLPKAYARPIRIMAIKGELTVMIPFLIFVLFNDLVEIHDGVSDLFSHLPVLFWISLLSLFLLLVYIMPGLLKILWQLKPLEQESTLRRELERFVSNQGFRVKNILIWNTNNLLVNAAILGVTPGTRYIVFTDAMIERLAPEEIKAVLAHEVGHGINRHLQIYLVFSTAFVFGVSLLENLIPPLIRLEGDPELLLSFITPAVLLYWWLVFGFLSRRFEMEADIFGAASLNSPLLFMSTLDRVARVGRVKRRKTSWRHFSIERRIESLKQVFFENPYIAFTFWRKMKWVRIVLVALSSLLFVFFAGDVAVDTLAGMGMLAYKDGDYETAERYLGRASDLPTGEIHRFALLKLYLGENKPGEALRLLADLTRSMPAGAAPWVIRNDVIGFTLLCTEKGEDELYLDAWSLADRLFPHDPELRKLKILCDLHRAGNPGPLQDWMEEKYGDRNR